MESMNQKKYCAFYGVDLSKNPSDISDGRLSYSENMYRNYAFGDGSATESIPGFRKLYDFGGKVYGIFSLKREKNGKPEDYILVHAADRMYGFFASERDSGQTLTPIASGLAARHSCLFTFENRTFFLDGTGYYLIDDNLTFKKIGTDIEPYVPTTRKNGEEYEQRNLLTNKFVNVYNVYSSADDAYSSEKLSYQIIAGTKNCRVYAKNKGISGGVVIPEHVTLNGDIYTVTEIGVSAFSDSGISEVFIPESVTVIGAFAFSNCDFLTRVVIPDGVKTISDSAYLGCNNITTIYLGCGLTGIGKQAFGGIDGITYVGYSGSEEEYSKITVASPCPINSVNYGIPQPESYALKLPLSHGCNSVTKITLNGTDITSKGANDGIHCERAFDDDGVFAIYVFYGAETELLGKEIKIYGTMKETADNDTLFSGFFSQNVGYTKGGLAAISGCKICASYDGRIFLTGNSELPNTVFYNTRNADGTADPLYFGVYDYINDGTANNVNCALMNVGGTLAVFKKSNGSEAAVYYHEPKETGDTFLPKIYPVTEGANSSGAAGGCYDFFDDPVFLSERGLEAIVKKQVNLERSIAHRSSNVDSMLTRHDLGKARMCIFDGYLCILADGEIFMADSRRTFTVDGHTEYEWFILTDIGVYEGDIPIYRTLDHFVGIYSVMSSGDYYSVLADEKEQEIYGNDERLIGCIYESEGNEPKSLTGIKVFSPYYGEDVILCDDTEERRGGTFSPACEIASVGGLLYFGTENGALCVFNTDKFEITDDGTYIINRRWYSHAGHSYNCVMITKSDDCDVPNMRKSTVPRTCAVRVKAMPGSSFSLSVRCDGITDNFGVACQNTLDFSEMDFANFSFSMKNTMILPIAEKKKGWLEKQYILFSQQFRRPFGVYEISYGYRTSGRMKNEY